MTDKAISGAAQPAAAGDAFEPEHVSWPRRLLRGILGNTGATAGLVIVATLFIVAIFAGLIAPYESDQMGAGRPLTAPNGDYWFGTDEFGRDIFSRVIFGAQLTIQVGVIAVGISLTVGLLVGLVGGYAGGWLERILMRGVDVVFSFTETLIALAAVAVLGPSLTNAMIAVGIAAQRHSAAARGRHPGCLHRRARGSRAQFPGTGRAAALPGMGRHALGRTRLLQSGALDHALPGHRHHGHGAGFQPAGRRHPRGSRPAAAQGVRQ